MSTPMEKIRKLQAMFRATGPEAANAKRLIEKLIAKYNLDPADIDKPEERFTKMYKTHRLKKWAMHLACWMKLDLRSIPGQPDFVAVKVTDDEWIMFHELLGEIKHIFNKMEHQFLEEAEKELMSKLSLTGEATIHFEGGMPSYYKRAILKLKNAKHYSFMVGYMKGNYPYNPKLCTVCKKGEIEQVDEGKWKCPECHANFHASGFHGQSIDRDAYNNGYATTTKALKNKVPQIGCNV